MLAAQTSEFYAATALPGVAGEGSLPALLLYILLALGVSFVCSLCEAVLFSASRSHIEIQVQAGRRAGRLLQQQKENVDRPITAILTLNTIAHTVGAAGAGAEATLLLGDELWGVVTIVLTLMILVFSEIIPKTIGAVYWKPLALPVAWVIQGMIVVFYPFVTAFERLTGLLTPRQKSPTVTRPELEVLAGISRGEGALEQREHAIITNLLRLGAAQVSDIMTPRTVMFALQEDMTVGEVIRLQRVLPYARMPLFSQSTDDARSFVLRNEVLMAAARDEHDRRLREMARPLHPVPVSMSVATVLDEFTARGEHMFLAFDEYGGTAGIVTMEDAIESLIGVEITDESDLVADLRQLADQRFRRQQELQGTIRGDADEEQGSQGGGPRSD
ncbi:MAG: HlyC/CorC family transporter [Anaerolineae bacterium]|nr:HlyC/CorC family transporter [Anaerolineae bacterium]